MIVRELIEIIQDIEPHQYRTDTLLVYVKTLEDNIIEYINGGYTSDVLGEELQPFIENGREKASLDDTMIVDEPDMYIEYLCWKIDAANREYDSANNHALMFNQAWSDFLHRFFIRHKDKIKIPRCIKGL